MNSGDYLRQRVKHQNKPYPVRLVMVTDFMPWVIRLRWGRWMLLTGCLRLPVRHADQTQTLLKPMINDDADFTTNSSPSDTLLHDIEELLNTKYPDLYADEVLVTLELLRLRLIRGICMMDRESDNTEPESENPYAP